MESAVPPTYDEATTRDPWGIVALYLSSNALCACSLVSKSWHSTFAPFLWGNPASHFGTENDRVYVALTRFKRTLPNARPSVRRLTHTLHLPPAQSEIYDGPKPEWLRDVLDKLPNLQSLIVSGLPFFDHQSLLALRGRGGASEDDYPMFSSPRLLIATRCVNATAVGLAEASLHWPNLAFLDLSGTPVARDRAVLDSLRFMTHLKILKLRHIGLKDEELAVLAQAVGLRLRSLDVRDNRLSDVSVRSLLSHCIHGVKDVHSSTFARRRVGSGEWAGMGRPDARVEDEFRGEDLDERFVRKMTRDVVRNLPSDDLPHLGLTHLYIANNLVTIEGIASVLRTQNLHVLDAGAVSTAISLGKHRSLSMTGPGSFEERVPGAEKLTPILERCASKHLRFLRIHAGVLKQPQPGSKDDVFGPGELDGEDAPTPELSGDETGIFELDNQLTVAHELDPTPAPIYELSGDAPLPLHELAGDPVPSTSCQGTTGSPTIGSEDTESRIRKASIFAPEPVYSDSQRMENGLLSPISQFANGVLNGPGIGITPPSRGISPIESSVVNPVLANGYQDNVSGSTPASNSTRYTISSIIALRNDLRQPRGGRLHGLLPGTLPRLSTLILTQVPTNDNEDKVIGSLKHFISMCAEELKLATLQANIEQSHLLTLYGQQRRRPSERIRQLFGLHTIVLEMAPLPVAHGPPAAVTRISNPTNGPSYSSNTPRYFHHSSYNPISSSPPRSWEQRTLSSTEDADSEALWAASHGDFSFFGDEECGQPADSYSLHTTSSHSSFEPREFDESPPAELPTPQTSPAPMQTHFPPDVRRRTRQQSQPQIPRSAPQKPSQATNQQHVGLDVIAELSKFRQERKARHEADLARGEKFTTGHWPGQIKVIRSGWPGVQQQEKPGEVEYYKKPTLKGRYR